MGEDKINMKVNVSIEDKNTYMEYFSEKSKMSRGLDKNIILRGVKVSAIIILYLIILPFVVYKDLLFINMVEQIIKIIIPIIATIYLLYFIGFKNKQYNIIYLLKEGQFNIYGIDMGPYDINNSIDEYNIGLDCQGITVETKFFKAEVDWGSLDEIVLFKNYLYLFETNKRIFSIIPLSEDNKEALLGFISRYSNKKLKKVK
ncbi:YcxB family protein [Hathewaya histolytica]|uniref:YcxB-like C-terminal domain-containing protein n=1 Tax=Hathewaya histolytica TaxID=1498 RepID=A0A4U9QTZ4_HATHI|nr:YcxB family protein [Hathewaya histolytica]VTQ81932.1 Uncharacterised protein [Hathewaya histolytica]